MPEILTSISIGLNICKAVLAFKDNKNIHGATAIWKAFTEAAGYKGNEAKLEELFNEALTETLTEEKEQLAKYAAQGGEVGLEARDFIAALKRSGISFEENDLLRMSKNDFREQLEDELENYLFIGGNRLSRQDISSLCGRFLDNLHEKLRDKIIKNQSIFNALLLIYLQTSEIDHREIKKQIENFVSEYKLEQLKILEYLDSITKTVYGYSSKLDKLQTTVDNMADRQELGFEELLDKIYSYWNTYEYNNQAVKRFFLQELNNLLGIINSAGEEEFQLLINAIILPFLPPYRKNDKIDYEKNYEFLRRIIFILTLLRIEFPELELKHDTGFPMKVTERYNICYLYTKENKTIEKSVIDFFTYDNDPMAKDSINKFLVSSATHRNCQGNLAGCKLRINNIVYQIFNVPDPKTDEQIQIFTDFSEKHRFIGHCDSCFTIDIDSEDKLRERLHKLMEVK